MHEVGIMQSALDIALDWAGRQGAARIHRLGLRVGALSGVVPDALDFAFEVIKRDTLAETAQLEVEYVPIRVFCPTCEREFTMEEYWYVCPVCENAQTEVRQGRELEITFVELSSEGGSNGVRNYRANDDGANEGTDARTVDG